MKSIKIYLLPLFLIAFFSTQVFSQDDFYNEKLGKDKAEQKVSKTDSIIGNEYFTEKDYNEIQGIKEYQKNINSEFYCDDEGYNKDEPKKRERDSFMNEVAAEVIVEVVVNTLFIIATFWH